MNSQSKEKFLQQLKEEMTEFKLFQQAAYLLQSGKINGAKQIISKQIGKKLFKIMEPKIDELFQIKQNRPIKQAKYLKTNPDGLKLYLLPFDKPLKNIKKQDVSTVLIVGMTGAGKSTFINSMVNQLLGVSAEDDFRYILIQQPDLKMQTKAVTSDVTIYGIPKQGKMQKAFQLIDIPGLGDTNGVKRDNLNINLISKKIQTEVPFINKVLYVFKSSQNRITKQCKYVMLRVMGMFGKDLVGHFLFVLTFADIKEALVIAALKQSFPDIIQNIQSKYGYWNIQINNSALMMKINPKNSIQTHFYQMGKQMLQKAIKTINQTEPQGTEMTIQVKKKRDTIQTTIVNLNQKIKNVTLAQQNIKSFTKTISNMRLDQLATQKLIYIHKPQIVPYKVETAKNNTTCMDCGFSCHEGCVYSNFSDKQNCCAMSNGYCTQCPKRCHWERHQNMSYIWKSKTVVSQVTNHAILDKYNISVNDKDAKEKLLLKYFQEYMNVVQETSNLCKLLENSHRQLGAIELRQVKPRTIIQYLEELIQLQMQGKQGDYLQRVKELHVVKQREQAKQLSKNGTQQFMKKYSINQVDNLIPDQEVKKTLFEKFKSSIDKIFN